jgi:hypothetical protein
MQLHTYIVLFEINTNFRLNKQKSTNINIKTCSNKLFHIYKIQIVFLYIQYVYCFEIARKIKFSQQKQLKLLPSQENDQEKLLSSKKNAFSCNIIITSIMFQEQINAIKNIPIKS